MNRYCVDLKGDYAALVCLRYEALRRLQALRQPADGDASFPQAILIDLCSDEVSRLKLCQFNSQVDQLN